MEKLPMENPIPWKIGNKTEKQIRATAIKAIAIKTAKIMKIFYTLSDTIFYIYNLQKKKS